MAIKTYKPTSAARRFYTTASFEEVTKKEPEKSLLAPKKRNAGRKNGLFRVYALSSDQG